MSSTAIDLKGLMLGDALDRAKESFSTFEKSDKKRPKVSSKKKTAKKAKVVPKKPVKRVSKVKPKSSSGKKAA